MIVATDEASTRDLDEARREELRRDPAVVVRRRTTREPFVSAIRVERPVDVLELIGRRDDEADGADESYRIDPAPEAAPVIRPIPRQRRA